jgi:hypothetical protein
MPNAAEKRPAGHQRAYSQHDRQPWLSDQRSRSEYQSHQQYTSENGAAYTEIPSLFAHVRVVVEVAARVAVPMVLRRYLARASFKLKSFRRQLGQRTRQSVERDSLESLRISNRAVIVDQ